MVLFWSLVRLGKKGRVLGRRGVFRTKMGRHSFLMGFALAMVPFSCTDGPERSKQWYKGNLHAHSYWSDGNEFPERIMEWYKAKGYQFTVLSDHNTLAEGDKWIRISKWGHLQKGFGNYLKKYGEGWVDHKRDSTGATLVKLKTLEEYRPLFEEDGNFLILPSEEITTDFNNRPIHINATNIQQKIMPRPGTSVAEVLQNNIDVILEQRKRSKVPILPHINHPNYGYAIRADDLVQVHGLRFFEVYNGHPLVNNTGDSTHLGTEAMWDLINASYLEQKKPLLYGIASDDSHHYHRYSKENSNPGRGWVMVQADSLSASGIIHAMEKGDFYASTGVVLKRVERKDKSLTIEVEPRPGTRYEIQYIGLERTTWQSKVLERVSGTKARFQLNARYLFVRAKVVSDQSNPNVFDESEYERAWTQPMVVDVEKGDNER